MSSATRAEATLDDLYRVEGKAELIGGRIVRSMPTGHLPNQIAAIIFVSLWHFVQKAGRGFAYTDGAGFVVPELASGRQSFSPDASYYSGRLPANRMRFIPGPPTFAVEVRSEGDSGAAAEAAIAAKRADYFEAGTLVVWDVDPVAEVIRCDRADSPDGSTVFRRGDEANAEPAVPGWSVPVDEIFG